MVHVWYTVVYLFLNTVVFYNVYLFHNIKVYHGFHGIS